MAKRISERELILPSLYLMSLSYGKITTSELIIKLRSIMKPTGEDLEILSGRVDDKFSQKVRNLRAHNTFEKTGFAEYRDMKRDSFVEITDLGRIHLKDNIDILKYLLINDFNYNDIIENLIIVEDKNKKRKIETFDENLMIREGLQKKAEVKVYERSKKLRDFAINYYQKKNKISCNCCTFNYEDFYGPDIAKGYIEIHHIKPIFKFDDEEIEMTLRDSIKNLLPVCSNCHRMIHRNWNEPIEIKILKESILNNGIINKKYIF